MSGAAAAVRPPGRVVGVFSETEKYLATSSLHSLLRATRTRETVRRAARVSTAFISLTEPGQYISRTNNNKTSINRFINLRITPI